MISLALTVALAAPAYEPSRLDWMLPNQPAFLSYENLLENTFSGVTYQLEESAGFSKIAPQKFAMEGNSWLWSRWYLDGFDITDPLFAGASALHVPFAGVGAVELRRSEAHGRHRAGGMWLETRKHTSEKMTVGGYGMVPAVLPNDLLLLDIERELTQIDYGISTLNGLHAVDRAPQLPRHRRGFRTNFDVYAQDAVQRHERVWSYATELYAGARRFNAFDSAALPLGADYEDFVLLSGVAQAALPGGGQDTLAFEYRGRDRLFRDHGFSPHETARLDTATLFWGRTEGARGYSALFKLYDVRHNDPGFTREQHDADGEGLFPFYPEGRFAALSASARQEHAPYFLELRNDAIGFWPRTRQWDNSLVNLGTAAGRVAWRSAPGLDVLGDYRAGASFEWEGPSLSVTSEIYGALNYSLNGRLINTLVFPNIGGKATAILWKGDTVAPFATLARTPMAITSQLTHLVSPTYQNGTFVDAAGTATLRTGGAHVDVASWLRQPTVDALHLGATFNFSPQRRLLVQGSAKYFENTLWLKLRGEPGAFGRTDMDGRYYFEGGATRYELVNAPLSHPPFFAQALVEYTANEPEAYVFSISLTAMIGMAYTAFGNGPLANDVGVVDWSMANPDARKNGYGRIDADRGYIAKLTWGQRVYDHLWSTLTVKYRDGQPFANYLFAESDGQVSLLYRTIRAETIKGKKGGPREDYLLNVNYQLAYDLDAWGVDGRASVSIANLVDLGHELNENVFAQRGRPPLEIELPRAVVFQLELAI